MLLLPMKLFPHSFFHFRVDLEEVKDKKLSEELQSFNQVANTVTSSPDWSRKIQSDEERNGITEPLITSDYLEDYLADEDDYSDELGLLSISLKACKVS